MYGDFMARAYNKEMKILFEDEYMLVLDKPAGWVVNRAESVEGETVQDWVEKSGKLRDDGDDVFVKRSGIAHRLDKETSGCLVVGKTPSVLRELMREFKERLVEKEYLAMVHGKLEPTRGVIKLPIGRNRKDRKQRMVHFDGKTAESRWLAESYLEDGKYSLVRIWPKTGRTHQIRVHMKFLGHTIVGDKLYGSEKEVREDRAVAGRQKLHAARISLVHPVSGEKIVVTSPVPNDF